MSTLKRHPFTSKDGKTCEWCTNTENHPVHQVDGIGADVAFMTGTILGGFWKQAAEERENGQGLGMFDDAQAEVDQFGNYTNRILVTTQRGTRFIITVEMDQP